MWMTRTQDHGCARGDTCRVRPVGHCNPHGNPLSIHERAAGAWLEALWAKATAGAPFASRLPSNDGLDSLFPLAEASGFPQSHSSAAHEACAGSVAPALCIGSSTPIGDGFDGDLLAAMLSPYAGCDNGIFEVEMPGGEKLGVVVQARGSGVGFLLSPANERTSTQLKRVRGELEGRVERRIGKGVTIAVL